MSHPPPPRAVGSAQWLPSRGTPPHSSACVLGQLTGFELLQLPRSLGLSSMPYDERTTYPSRCCTAAVHPGQHNMHAGIAIGRAPSPVIKRQMLEDSGPHIAGEAQRCSLLGLCLLRGGTLLRSSGHC